MKYGQRCSAVQASKDGPAMAVRIPKRQRTGPVGWASEPLPRSSAPAPPALPAAAVAGEHASAAVVLHAALQSRQSDALEAVRPALPPGTGAPSRSSAGAATTPSAPLLPAASAAQLLAQLQHYRVQQQQQHLARAMSQAEPQALLRPFELPQQGNVPGATEPWLQAQQQFAALIQLQQQQQQWAQPQHVPRLLQQQVHRKQLPAQSQQPPEPQMQTHHLSQPPQQQQLTQPRPGEQVRPRQRAASVLQEPPVAPLAPSPALSGSAAQLEAAAQPRGSVQKPRQSNPPPSGPAKVPAQKLRARSRASLPAPAASPQVGERLAVSTDASPGPFLTTQLDRFCPISFRNAHSCWKQIGIWVTDVQNDVSDLAATPCHPTDLSCPVQAALPSVSRRVLDLRPGRVSPESVDGCGPGARRRCIGRGGRLAEVCGRLSGGATAPARRNPAASRSCLPLRLHVCAAAPDLPLPPGRSCLYACHGLRYSAGCHQAASWRRHDL